MKKSRIRKARDAIYDGFVKAAIVADMRHDPFLLMAIASDCFTAIVTEYVGSKKLHEAGGIDSMVNFAVAQMTKDLRERLQARLDHEKAQTKQ